MYKDDEFVDYEDFYDYYSSQNNAYIEEAKEAIKGIFLKDPTNVFYLKQLEVRLEKQFFHWVTYSAIKGLINEGFLSNEKRYLSKSQGTMLSFVFNRKNRYYIRKINEYTKIVKSYSKPTISRAYGRQAEILFLSAFLKRGFEFISENTNEFNGKKWKESNHNLDFIIRKDGIVYGCEVKNTFDYITTDQLDIKLKICEYLQITPLFIMRYAPKTYNKKIIDKGGFALIFEAQIYPLGQESLVQKIKDVLELPVDCPSSIPDGIINRFMKLHNRKVSNL